MRDRERPGEKIDVSKECVNIRPERQTASDVDTLK